MYSYGHVSTSLIPLLPSVIALQYFSPEFGHPSAGVGCLPPEIGHF